MYRGTFKEGKPDGRGLAYHENGQIMMESGIMDTGIVSGVYLTRMVKFFTEVHGIWVRDTEGE